MKTLVDYDDVDRIKEKLKTKLDEETVELITGLIYAIARMVNDEV